MGRGIVWSLPPAPEAAKRRARASAVEGLLRGRREVGLAAVGARAVVGQGVTRGSLQPGRSEGGGVRGTSQRPGVPGSGSEEPGLDVFSDRERPAGLTAHELGAERPAGLTAHELGGERPATAETRSGC
jgi:hypothetical protein